MNTNIRDIIQVALDDNIRIWDLVEQIYRAGVESAMAEQPKGLPGVTEAQVGLAITRINDDPDCMGLAEGLTNWFNAPNRDAPVEPTMHPDLEWMASLPMQQLNRTAMCLGRSPVFYRHNNRLFSARSRDTVDPGVPMFSWDEVKQARRHLAKVQRHGPVAQYDCSHETPINRDHAIPFLCPECGNGTFAKAVGLQPDAEYRVTFTGVEGEGPDASDAFTTKELAEYRKAQKEEYQRQVVQKAEEFKEKDPYALDARDRMMHDLINLPDYETWFEAHGNSETVLTGDGDRPPSQCGGERTTVHELYTHFRARLLDELRQAGVIGDDS